MINALGTPQHRRPPRRCTSEIALAIGAAPASRGARAVGRCWRPGPGSSRRRRAVGSLRAAGARRRGRRLRRPGRRGARRGSSRPARSVETWTCAVRRASVSSATRSRRGRTTPTAVELRPGQLRRARSASACCLAEAAAHAGPRRHRRALVGGRGAGPPDATSCTGRPRPGWTASSWASGEALRGSGARVAGGAPWLREDQDDRGQRLPRPLSVGADEVAGGRARRGLVGQATSSGCPARCGG